MKSIKLHLIVLVIIVIAELIGNIVINVGIGKIVLLPMMYALIMGVLTAPKFTKISGEKEIHAASGLLGVTLVLLMARYGTLGRTDTAENPCRVSRLDSAGVR